MKPFSQIAEKFFRMGEKIGQQKLLNEKSQIMEETYLASVHANCNQVTKQTFFKNICTLKNSHLHDSNPQILKKKIDMWIKRIRGDHVMYMLMYNFTFSY